MRKPAAGGSSAAPGGPRESGSGLIATILVAAILATTGAALLQVSAIESRISARRRDRDQVLNVAESGALMVKSWFDRPVSGDPARPATLRNLFLGRDLRHPGLFIRSRRMIDHDGDPLTARIAADGSPGREIYRQGRQVSPASPHLSFFHKPYRGSIVDAFLGSEDGPDIVLEDQPGAADLLDHLNQEMFPRQRSTGRIERIEIYAPPSTSPAGRLGIATVKVTAAKYPLLTASGGVAVVPPGAVPVARAVVRMGLAEIPVTAPRGPLESCGDLTAAGILRARWGRVIARGAIALPTTLPLLDAAVSSAVPYASYGRRISGIAPGDDLATWLSSPDDSIEDPWLKIIAGGDLVGWESLPDHPFPHVPSAPIDGDHSNLFQRVPFADCSRLEYALWKGIAREPARGMRDVHYFSFDEATALFRLNGTGPARSFREWTDGRDGIFFFDTADGAAPGPANLTPAVAITGGSWSTAGLVYLNAESFLVDGTTGRPRVLLPPGEPFDDADHDGARAALEDFVNLRYPTTIGTGAATDDFLKNLIAAQSASASAGTAIYEEATSMQRDPAGLPLLEDVNLFGVLYNSGDIILEGDAVHHGSLVAGRDMIQRTPGAPTPTVTFDSRLDTGTWPPAEIRIPRTHITSWQSSP